jgi:hypothetical protein
VGWLRIRPKPIFEIEIPLDFSNLFTNSYTRLNSNEIQTILIIKI